MKRKKTLKPMDTFMVDRMGQHAWSVLGWLWLELGDDARAAGACVRALDLRPGLGEALLTCSLLAARAGDRDTAAGLLAQARRSGVPLTILEGYARLAA
jgi:hypothetical protein